jgi:hypothetical protein
VLGQRAAASPARLGAGALEGRIGLLLLGLGFGDRLFDILQHKIELIRVELFRAPAELQALQLADQVAQPVILTGELRLFGALGVAFSTGLGEQRAQRGNLVRQRLGSRVHGPIGPHHLRFAASHARGESIGRSSPGHLGPRNPRRVHPPPVEPVE